LGELGQTRVFQAKRVSVPVAVSAFPDELYRVPPELGRAGVPKLIHHNKLDKGGSLRGVGTAQLLSEEVHAGFRSLSKIAKAS